MDKNTIRIRSRTKRITKSKRERECEIYCSSFGCHEISIKTTNHTWSSSTVFSSLSVGLSAIVQTSEPYHLLLNTLSMRYREYHRYLNTTSKMVFSLKNQSPLLFNFTYLYLVTPPVRTRFSIYSSHFSN